MATVYLGFRAIRNRASEWTWGNIYPADSIAVFSVSEYSSRPASF